jgi:hypothetical protein
LFLLQYTNYSGNVNGEFSRGNPGFPVTTQICRSAQAQNKRAVTVMAAPLQSKQRVRSEGAAGTGINDVKGNKTLARLAPVRSG